MDMADTRKCIGSATFRIEAHEAPIGDFPAQPSQKDGLGRMCKPHWNQYTKALRKAALARKAAEAGASTEVAPTEPEAVVVASPKAVGGKTAKKAGAPKPEPIRTRVPRERQEAAPEAGSRGDAG
jgi:hypothetical protein